MSQKFLREIGPGSSSVWGELFHDGKASSHPFKLEVQSHFGCEVIMFIHDFAHPNTKLQ